MGGGKRRVAAQLDFDQGREPAEMKSGAGGHQKRRLRLVHLAGDALQPRVIPPAVEHIHGGRIAGEWFGREGIDEMKCKRHTRTTSASPQRKLGETPGAHALGSPKTRPLRGGSRFL